MLHVVSAKRVMIKVARRSKNTITPRLLLLLTQDLDLNSVLYLLAGVLEDIQTDFNVGDDKGGLLQTAFVISYMIFAPLFGYLGDRYSRRAIMAFGVFLWGVTTLLGSFMQVCNPPHRYGFCNLFLRHHIYFKICCIFCCEGINSKTLFVFLFAELLLVPLDASTRRHRGGQLFNDCPYNYQ